MLSDRQFAAATERNRDPILEVLQRVLPPMGTVLEVASGTGQHAVYFAPRLTPRFWLPSEPSADGRASIRAWAAADPAPNLGPPLALDLGAVDWVEQVQAVLATTGLPPAPGRDSPGLNPEPPSIREPWPAIAAMVAINLIHISPWSTCLSLMAGARQLLPKGGILYLYGPYHRNGLPTSPSNLAFDTALRRQNPNWGVRDLEAVIAAAAEQTLALQEVVTMPAHNLSVIFQKPG